MAGLHRAINYQTGAVADDPHPDPTAEELAAAAAREAQAQREDRRRTRLRNLKAAFRSGSSTENQKNKALGILCGMALQDLADDADNGGT